MKNFILRLCTCCILLLLLPSLGWADDPSTSTTLGGLGMPPPGDASVVYLGFVFGVVGGLIHGTGSQIMGHMFAQFNSAILALAGLIVIYTTLLGILNTAHEGEFLGKKYSSFFIPFRTVLGIMLIVPTTSGYSWIQVIAMWVVLQGVSTANLVWHAAIRYILFDGGVIITQNQDINSAINQEVRKNMVLLSSSVACLHTLQGAANEITTTQPGKVPVPSKSMLNSVIDTVSTGNASLMPNFDPKIDPYWAPLNGACGNLKNITAYNAVAMRQALLDLYASTQPVTGVCDAAFYTPDPNQPKQWIKKPGLPPGIVLSSTCAQPNQCIPNGLGADIHLDDSQINPYGIPGVATGSVPVMSWCNPINQSSISNMDQSINIATLDYAGLDYKRVTPLDQSSGPLQLAWAVDPDYPEYSSWFNAGAYYFALLKASSRAQEDVNGNQMSFQVTFDKSPFANSNGSPALQSIGNALGTNTGNKLTMSKKAMENITGSVNESIDYVFAWTLPFFSTTGEAAPNDLIPNFLALQKQSENIGHEADQNGHSLPTPDFNTQNNSVISDLTLNISSLFIAFQDLQQAQQTNLSPLILLMQFGGSCIRYAIDTWILILSLYVGLAALLAPIPSVNMGIVMNVLSVFLSPLVTVLLTPILVNGIMLLIYLPAVPFMIFTFGTIGWIIGVIEAMIAAPVVGFGIMHPEGSDVFGKGDQALMLILNLFLRPPLMIFGLIAGIMISSIGVWTINWGYAMSVIPFIKTVSESWQTNLVVALAAPILYMLMVVQIVNRSFTLIYNFPDKVTRWLSGGLQESLGQEMSSAEKEVRTQTESAARTGGEVGGSVAKTLPSALSGSKEPGAGNGDPNAGGAVVA